VAGGPFPEGQPTSARPVTPSTGTHRCQEGGNHARVPPCKLPLDVVPTLVRRELHHLGYPASQIEEAANVAAALATAVIYDTGTGSYYLGVRHGDAGGTDAITLQAGSIDRPTPAGHSPRDDTARELPERHAQGRRPSAVTPPAGASPTAPAATWPGPPSPRPSSASTPSASH
jgi:hypothetical protein